MNLGETAVDLVAEAQPELVSQARYTTGANGTGSNAALVGSIATVICTGLDHTRAQTDQGLYNGADGILRFKTEDEPAAWKTNDAIVGQVIEVLLYGATVWVKVRVMTRRVSLGATRLNVVAEYAEI